MQFNVVAVLSLLWMAAVHATPSGNHTCTGVVKHSVTVRVNVTEPVTYRTYTWCLRVPPRCSKYTVQLKDRVKIHTEMHNRTITVCCKGYVEMDYICVPACPPFTECPNMHCNRTNHCYCTPGYQGLYCNYPCDRGFWGTDCKKACDCPEGFTCHHLTGDCMLDDRPPLATKFRRTTSTTVPGVTPENTIAESVKTTYSETSMSTKSTTVPVLTTSVESTKIPIKTSEYIKTPIIITSSTTPRISTFTSIADTKIYSSVATDGPDFYQIQKESATVASNLLTSTVQSIRFSEFSAVETVGTTPSPTLIKPYITETTIPIISLQTTTELPLKQVPTLTSVSSTAKDKYLLESMQKSTSGDLPITPISILVTNAKETVFPTSMSSQSSTTEATNNEISDTSTTPTIISTPTSTTTSTIQDAGTIYITTTLSPGRTSNATPTTHIPTTLGTSTTATYIAVPTTPSITTSTTTPSTTTSTTTPITSTTSTTIPSTTTTTLSTTPHIITVIPTTATTMSTTTPTTTTTTTTTENTLPSNTATTMSSTTTTENTFRSNTATTMSTTTTPIITTITSSTPPPSTATTLSTTTPIFTTVTPSITPSSLATIPTPTTTPKTLGTTPTTSNKVPLITASSTISMPDERNTQRSKIDDISHTFNFQDAIPTTTNVLSVPDTIPSTTSPSPILNKTSSSSSSQSTIPSTSAMPSTLYNAITATFSSEGTLSTTTSTSFPTHTIMEHSTLKATSPQFIPLPTLETNKVHSTGGEYTAPTNRSIVLNKDENIDTVTKFDSTTISTQTTLENIDDELSKPILIKHLLNKDNTPIYVTTTDESNISTDNRETKLYASATTSTIANKFVETVFQLTNFEQTRIMSKNTSALDLIDNVSAPTLNIKKHSEIPPHINQSSTTKKEETALKGIEILRNNVATSKSYANEEKEQIDNIERNMPDSSTSSKAPMFFTSTEPARTATSEPFPSTLLPIERQFTEHEMSTNAEITTKTTSNFHKQQNYKISNSGNIPIMELSESEKEQNLKHSNSGRKPYKNGTNVLGTLNEVSTKFGGQPYFDLGKSVSETKTKQRTELTTSLTKDDSLSKNVWFTTNSKPVHTWYSHVKDYQKKIKNKEDVKVLKSTTSYLEMLAATDKYDMSEESNIIDSMHTTFIERGSKGNSGAPPLANEQSNIASSYLQHANIKYNLSGALAEEVQAGRHNKSIFTLYSTSTFISGVALILLISTTTTLWFCNRRKRKQTSTFIGPCIMAYGPPNEYTLNPLMYETVYPLDPLEEERDIDPEIFFCPTFTNNYAERINRELSELNYDHPRSSVCEPVYAEIRS